MEVSGAVLRKVSCPSFSRHVPCRGVVPRGGFARISMRPRTVMMGSSSSSSGFSDDGHLQYYEEKKKGTALMSPKKKLKMLKGLSKGLSLFPEFRVSLDPEKQALFDDLQGKLTSDAAEVLMEQIEQLRAEEKELKRKKKQEKDRLKASKKMNTAIDCESSSSSSSESSDSDCDCDEVVDMNSMRASESPPALLPKTATKNHPPKDDDASELFSRNDTCVRSINGGVKKESAVVITAPSQKRIEVCMGNKCKKSGAATLLQEFEKVVGVEGAVVSCKCMGKCKSAQNVRIQNPVDSIVQGLNDSLFIGVGLDDVDAIVARFLGEENLGNMDIAYAAT